MVTGIVQILHDYLIVHRVEALVLDEVLCSEKVNSFSLQILQELLLLALKELISRHVVWVDVALAVRVFL